MNVVHYSSLKAVKRQNKEKAAEKELVPAGSDIGDKREAYGKENDHSLSIYLSDVPDGVRREFIKKRRPFVA